MITDELIEKVLANRGTPEEAEEVAAYFATEKGQMHLSRLVDEEFALLENGKAPEDRYFRAEKVNSEVRRSIRRCRTKRIFLGIAAAVLPIAVCAGVLFYADALTGGAIFEEANISQVVVPNGDKIQVILQDGSTACLNSGSVLSYPDRFAVGSRDVTLSGEGYFNVTSNPRRPFIIHFDGGTVRVLGTSFNLSTYAQEKTVVLALDKGKVEMTFGNDSYNVKPGQVLYYDKTKGTATLTTGGSAQKSKWMEGVISFKSASLDEIATTLARTFDVEFSISPKIDTNVLYTFTSSRSDLGKLLEELSLIAPVKISRDGGIINVEPKK